MFEIVEKRELAQNIYLTRVKAPRIARSAQPGQFVIVRADKVGERTPLTIAWLQCYFVTQSLKYN